MTARVAASRVPDSARTREFHTHWVSGSTFVALALMSASAEIFWGLSLGMSVSGNKILGLMSVSV